MQLVLILLRVIAQADGDFATEEVAQGVPQEQRCLLRIGRTPGQNDDRGCSCGVGVRLRQLAQVGGEKAVLSPQPGRRDQVVPPRKPVVDGPARRSGGGRYPVCQGCVRPVVRSKSP